MLDNLMALFSQSGGLFNPALGSVMASNPEIIAQHLAAQGVPPPTEGQPHVPPDVEAQSWLRGGTPVSSSPAQPQPYPSVSLPPLSVRPPGAPPAEPPRGMPSFSEAFPSIANLPNPLDALRSGWNTASSLLPQPRPALGRVPESLPTTTPTYPDVMPPAATTSPPVADTRGISTGPSPDFPPATPSAQKLGLPNALSALAGVRAPEAPRIQNIRSPDTPRPLAIQRDPQLAQLLLQASGTSPQVNPLFLKSALLSGRY